jgi:hypothetical protein
VRGAVTGVAGSFVLQKPTADCWGVGSIARRREAKGEVLEGAVFKAVSGSVDHLMRRLFGRLAGSWPGGDSPEARH